MVPRGGHTWFVVEATHGSPPVSGVAAVGPAAQSQEDPTGAAAQAAVSPLGR